MNSSARPEVCRSGGPLQVAATEPLRGRPLSGLESMLREDSEQIEITVLSSTRAVRRDRL